LYISFAVSFPLVGSKVIITGGIRVIGI